MELFLCRAKQEHLAFDYVEECHPDSLVYPALSTCLTQFFDQNNLSVPCNLYIDKLISLSEHQSSPPCLFEILVCKQRGSWGHHGTLQIGAEDGLSTESLTYQRMGAISKQYCCPDKPQIVVFIGMHLIIYMPVW
jgi:hypothetical protein